MLDTHTTARSNGPLSAVYWLVHYLEWSPLHPPLCSLSAWYWGARSVTKSMVYHPSLDHFVLRVRSWLCSLACFKTRQPNKQWIPYKVILASYLPFIAPKKHMLSHTWPVLDLKCLIVPNSPLPSLLQKVRLCKSVVTCLPLIGNCTLLALSCSLC